MSQPTIHFYLDDPQAVERMRHADVERDWRIFHTGPQVWIGQTYCRLAAAGMPVTLTAQPPTRGIVVAHRDDLPRLIAALPVLPAVTIVGVRADRDPHAAAAIEIVQNGAGSGGRAVHIPHWPQPGLVPRDPARGTTVAAAAFKGSGQEIADDLRAPGWAATLRSAGVEWVESSAAWQGRHAVVEVDWNDYSAVDLLVAVRRPRADLYANKPASKLVNAWAAGVPAILGPELAFRELRRSPLDYIEAATGEEALAAVMRLKGDAGLYRAMVDNGRQRALDFTPERITAMWCDVLGSIAQPGLKARVALTLRAIRQRVRKAA